MNYFVINRLCTSLHIWVYIFYDHITVYILYMNDVIIVYFHEWQLNEELSQQIIIPDTFLDFRLFFYNMFVFFQIYKYIPVDL